MSVTYKGMGARATTVRQRREARLHHHGHELVVVDLPVAVTVHLRQDRLDVLPTLCALELHGKLDAQ
jgi:hypothetical protein